MHGKQKRKRVYKALTGNQLTFVDEKDAELKLREKLENRNCLLVIDDVWQRPRLEPFLQGGKQTCARLITTRRLDLVMDARPVHVDEMTPEEAVALLATRVPAEHRSRDLQPFHRLASRLMNWPLLLKLAGGCSARASSERIHLKERSITLVRRAVKDNALASVALQRLLEAGQVIELKHNKQRLCIHSVHLP